MAIDEQKVEEAVGKVFGELSVDITGPLIVLGDRLGLWAAGGRPAYPAGPGGQDRNRRALRREWLRAVAVAGYVGYDR